MNWDNVVAAGSAIITPLLPVPSEYSASKRSLREYYHQIVAPASDVDLFLYGLTEEEGVEKIKQIERQIRDSVLEETTTVRTKHAITICSQYPTRHIQIVLRLYKSVSEILTGFDVDCSCAAYDGKQVYASPRALASYMTQVNQIDMSRRSPSYENRLSKYSHRGFEAYWPLLDRSRIDPTIFERSFRRTLGLARLLVLEKLPTSNDRESYLERRRLERGRPPLHPYAKHAKELRGNIKDKYEDEVAEWVETDQLSDYHTFTIPYGEKFTAKRIEKLLYTKDLLLNSEWNKPKDREVHLHRHPAFFGFADAVMEDCCGFCPKPANPEEEEVAAEEGKIYVSGKVSFLTDNPGRQTIGSFNPVENDQWTAMAYVGSTEKLFQAIVDDDLAAVKEWLAQDGADVNRRDYTGRTALQLAAVCSTPQIVRCLIDNGARLVARMADGKTALHLACQRGNVEIVKLIMIKSEANEAAEEGKKILKKSSQSTSQSQPKKSAAKAKDSDDDEEMSDGAESWDDAEASDDGVHSRTTGSSYVNVLRENATEQSDNLPDREKEDELDWYDINILTWDDNSAASPLHWAIAAGHGDVVKELCSQFGADPLLPVKLLNDFDKSPRGAVMTLVLALGLEADKFTAMVTALVGVGATSSQSDTAGISAFHYFVNNSDYAVETLLKADPAAVRAVMGHVTAAGSWWAPSVTEPLITAIEKKHVSTVKMLLKEGVKAELEFSSFMKAAKVSFDKQVNQDTEENMKKFHKSVSQPLCVALESELPLVAAQLLDGGASPNTITKVGWTVIDEEYARTHQGPGETVLDIVRRKIDALEKWKPTAERTAPEALADDESYLAEFKTGSYAHFTATSQLSRAKEDYIDKLKLYNQGLEEDRKKVNSEAEKDRAIKIKQLVRDYRAVEEKLLAAEAKTFKELHPTIEYTPRPSYQWSPKTTTGPFEPKINFQRGDLTDASRAAYLELCVDPQF